MPLSPFRARLVVACYLAICGGIATNLLAFQKSGPLAGQKHSDADRARLALDAERLRRLAIDALGGGPDEVLPAPAVPVIMNATTAAPARQRVGSFAPSAGSLASAALPGVDPAEARRATIAAVQTELGRRGYAPGVADGTTGLVTRAAVLAYEYDQGLPMTADPSPEVLAHLRHGTSAPGTVIGLDEAGSRPGHAETVIRAIQQSLRSLGYLTLAPDGQVSDDTVRAIREFEMDAGLVPTGRISAPLVVKLTRQLNSRNRG